MTSEHLRQLADNLFQQGEGGYLVSRNALAATLRDAADAIERWQDATDLWCRGHIQLGVDLVSEQQKVGHLKEKLVLADAVIDLTRQLDHDDLDVDFAIEAYKAHT